MTDIKLWLENLGLLQYRSVFADNDIDTEVLSELTETDLEKLGVSLGHRKKMLKVIAQEHRQDRRVEAPPESSTDMAEFRYLTVMFCDLVGSTELTTRLGAEDMRTVNRRCQGIWKAAVEIFDGYIARYMGDAVLVYFGYPISYENAAERAVLTGLDIVERMNGLDAGAGPTGHLELQVRIGIATGQVVVEQIGQGGSMEKAAVGEAPNLAARLQSLASPNRIVIADQTRRLVGDAFEYRELGEHGLKGISGKTKAWEVLRASTMPGRFAAARGTPLGAFVNRYDEMNLLLTRWQHAAAGEGQVVVLSGDAGIGKSRVLEVMLERVDEAGLFLVRLYCSPYHTRSVLSPVLEWLKREANLTPADSPGKKQEKLDHLLIEEYQFSEKQLDAFRALAAFQPNELRANTDLSPQEHMVLFQDALIESILKRSAGRPILIVLEDAHWADPTTRNVIDMLVDQIHNARILIFLTSRPEGCPDYNRPHVTRLSLNRLNSRDTTALINDIGKRANLPLEVVDRIKQKCDGVPLYVEEITKMVMDVEDTETMGKTLSVPDTLKASLLARLDRLGDAKNFAQIASVVGKDISAEIVASLCDSEQSSIEQGLEQLIHHNVLYRRTSGAESRYEFRHALLKDAAYASLLKADRMRIHESIADYLCARAEENPEVHLELIAYHFLEAGRTNPAFEYWLRAGQEALNSGATMEAVAIFASASGCVPRDDEKRSELAPSDLYALHMGRGKALNAAFGASSMEAHESFRQAQAVSEKAGNVDWLVDALDYQFGITFNAGSLVESIRPAESMIEIGEAGNHLGALISGYQGMGMARFAQGKFRMAREVLEKSLKFKDQNVDGVNCYPSMTMTYLSYVLFVMGEPEQARSMCSAALESARKESVRSTATALSNCCYTWQFLDDPQSMAAHADELVGLAEEKGMYMFKNRGLFFKNLADARMHGNEDSLTSVVDAVEKLLDSGEEIEIPFLLGVIADLQMSFGKPADACETLARAISIAQKNDEKFFLAELLRLSGTATLALEAFDRQRACAFFDEAIEVARLQEARSWEQKAVKERERIL